MGALSGAGAAPSQRRLHSTGTGFAISQDGQIVTNYHVVNECAEVRVRAVGQEVLTGAVVARDAGNDLALLRTPARLPAAVLRNDSGIRPGDSVVAVGFPLPELLASEANVTTGTVNSGGPLLDLQGRVVGVVVGKLDALRVANLTGDIPQNVNFAIKAGVVRSFLDASGVGSAADGVETDRWWEDAPLGDSPAAVGAEAKAFTVLVECWK